MVIKNIRYHIPEFEKWIEYNFNPEKQNETFLPVFHNLSSFTSKEISQEFIANDTFRKKTEKRYRCLS